MGRILTSYHRIQTLASTGSPISKIATRSHSLVDSATCNTRLNRSTRFVSDPFQDRERIAAEAVRVPRESIPRKRQRSDGSPDPDVDNSSTSRSSASLSTPDTNKRTTRQVRQDNNSHSPGMTPKTARSTHDSLYRELRRKLTPTDQKGFMYVLCDPHNKRGGYKIGWTTRVFRERIIEHEKGCNFTADIIHVSDHEIENCSRLEKLVHTDLESHCVPLHCDKHKSVHKEWFQVTEEMAVGTVKKWEKFMHREKPYGWNRQLKIVWEYLLETRAPTSLDVRTLAHDARREHWERIIAPPTTDDYLQAYRARIQLLLKNLFCNLCDTWLYVQKFFWPISSLIYGMITLVLARNLLAFYAFVFVLVCASVHVMSHVTLSPPKRKSRTPKKMNAVASPLQG